MSSLPARGQQWAPSRSDYKLAFLIVGIPVAIALILFAIYFLLPLFVMLVNSVKPLAEIRGGNMLALPQEFTLAPWLSAWGTAQIGVEPTGLKPYFWNSIKMVVPAVAISTLLGALSGYVLTKWRFCGDNLVFGMMLLACFIPFQIVLIPMARILGLIGLAAMILLVGLASIIMRNAQQNQALVVPEAAPTVAVTPPAQPASDPLADAGVVPDMSTDSAAAAAPAGGAGDASPRP